MQPQLVGGDSCSCKVDSTEWLQQSVALRPSAAFAHVHVASVQHADDTVLLRQIDCGTTMKAYAPRHETFSKISALSQTAASRKLDTLSLRM